MVNIKLHNHICAFLDILGGANLFRGKDRDKARDFFQLLESFEERMNGWSRHFPDKRQSSVLVKTFSDNIFVAFPLRSNKRMEDKQVVSLFLTELADRIREITLLGEFPLRGGVAVGPLMFTEKFLFGPALLECVNLEKTANFPRVLISNSVIKYIDQGSYGDRHILRDADGMEFLDYMGVFLPDLEPHKRFVQNGLLKNKNKNKERGKYEWLARYHNYVAKERGREDLSISIDQSYLFSRGTSGDMGLITKDPGPMNYLTDSEDIKNILEKITRE